MATFQRFEDIEAWQIGRELTRAIYVAFQKDAFARDWALRDQIRKASISITSNIAEGFERGTDREFSHFLSIAKGSAGEVRSQLYVALDQAYIDRSTFDHLYHLAMDVSRRISGLRRYLKKEGA